MRSIIFLLLALSPIALMAQLKVEGYTIQQLGIEHNPLRSPSELINGSGDYLERDTLNPNALMSYSKVYINAQHKWDKSKLEIKPLLTYQYYPGLRQANYLKADLQQKWSVKLNKKLKVYEYFFWRKSRRNFENVDEVFRIPSSYNRFFVGIGTEYKFKKRWTLQTEALYLNNKFQTEAGNINQFAGWEGTIGVKRKFKRAEPINHIEFSLKNQHRNWLRGSETNAKVDTAIMNYWTAKAEISFDQDKYTTWKPFIKITGRTSSNEVQAWMGWQAGTSLKWRKDNFQLDWSGSIANRNYPELFPEGGFDQEDLEEEDFEAENLRYFFLRNRIHCQYFFSDQLSAILTIGHIHRLSSFDEPEKAAFRPYQNAYVRLGIKAKF